MAHSPDNIIGIQVQVHETSMKLGRESVAPASPDGHFPKPPKHVLRNWSLDNQFGTVAAP